MAEGMQQTVQRLARALGFTLAGVAPIRLDGDTCASSLDTLPELTALEPWIAEGRAGEMEYLKRRDGEGRLLRSSVTVPFPWVRSVVVCAVNYNSDQPYSSDPVPGDEPAGWIARYAWSGRPAGTDPDKRTATDYHAVIRSRLEELRAAMERELGVFEARCFVDTGPLVERVYARYAGLGWVGKNTCLIEQQAGSWLFLGVILTSLELPPEQRAALAPDRCGSCTRCIDACPTQALEPYRMDASRCIAYLTIEKRGALPEELAPLMGRHVFGCDICQEVCPWNRRAPLGDWPELQPRPELVNPALDWLGSVGPEEFRAWFRGSPVERTKPAGLARNVENARRNRTSGDWGTVSMDGDPCQKTF
jgi:epoxyqueuosine reductase